MKKVIHRLKAEIVEVGKRIYNRGFVASNDGNVSARIDKNKILITPTGISKGFMKPDDLIVLDLDGNLVEGKRKQSSEANMHLQIYKSRPDVMSVCHTHPPYATGFAVAGIPLDKMVLPEVIIVLGSIPLVEYGTTGTDELYGMISKYVLDYDAFLLANHGVVTLGKTVIDAYHKMETVEHAAKIQFIAAQLGNVNTLNKKQTGKLIEFREKFGVRKNVGLPSAKKSKKK
ncbi:MAG: L-fuculose-phosphate aldolase [Stygiobacter sp.]|nr:MAG: L-fuculose-phosphate aldolase [Stygiobacter sp.]KAF0216974.1 MAG: L-fuculose-phosphate [Ignavibacteria bacterium]